MSYEYPIWQIRWESNLSVIITGEPRDTETVMRGSERAVGKVLPLGGNSLAAYSTSRTVLRLAITHNFFVQSSEQIITVL